MTKKSCFAFILLFLSIAVFIVFILYLNNNNYNWNEFCGNDSDIEEIIKSRQETKNDLILSLSFNENNLIKDVETKSWYYSVVENDKSAFSPVVSFKTKKRNVRLMFNSDITQNTVSSNQTIKFIAYNDDEYCQYTLKCTSLPIMCLDNNQCVLFDNRKDIPHRVTKSDSLYSIRGRNTRKLEKKSYKLELKYLSAGENSRNNSLPLLGMGSHSTWHLNALYNDPEKIRSTFCSQLWYESCGNNNSFGLKNGNEYRFLELFIDGKYHGLYALGYPVNKDTLQINKDELLFKKVLYSKELEDDFYHKETTEKDEIFNGYVMKSGDLVESSWQRLGDYYKVLKETNSQNYKNLYNIVDIDNAIDCYLYFTFIQGNDNVVDWSFHNVYVGIKKRNGKDVVVYTPWDMDMTFGSDWNADGHNYTLVYEFDSSYNENIMRISPVEYLLKYNDSDIKEMIYKRYCYLREHEWSEKNITQMLDDYEKNIYDSGAYEREKERWPDGTYYDGNKLETFKNYVIERLYYMDKYVEGICDKNK